MKLLWEERAWQEYLDWQSQDKKTLKRNAVRAMREDYAIIKDIQRGGEGGIGKPERLKGKLSGCLSRRIDEANRLVYEIHDDAIVIK